MEISRIDSLFPVRPPAGTPTPEAAARPPGQADQVQISPHARFQNEIRNLPDVRAERIAFLRKSIESGTYETPQRLQSAAARLLDDLR